MIDQKLRRLILRSAVVGFSVGLQLRPFLQLRAIQQQVRRSTIA